MACDRHRAETRRAGIQHERVCHEIAAVVDEPSTLLFGAVRLARALDKLAPDHRAVLRAAYEQGLTHAQIAGREGLPLGTVKSRIDRALRAMRVALEVEPRDARPSTDAEALNRGA